MLAAETVVAVLCAALVLVAKHHSEFSEVNLFLYTVSCGGQSRCERGYFYFDRSDLAFDDGAQKVPLPLHVCWSPAIHSECSVCSRWQ